MVLTAAGDRVVGLAGDGRVSPEFEDSLQLGGTGHRHDTGTAQLGELHEGAADSAGRARDRDGLAGTQSDPLQHVLGCGPGAGERGQPNIGQLSGDRICVLARHRAVLRETAVTFAAQVTGEFAIVGEAGVPNPGVHQNSAAQEAVVGAFTDRNDHPGDVSALDAGVGEALAAPAHIVEVRLGEAVPGCAC